MIYCPVKFLFGYCNEDKIKKLLHKYKTLITRHSLLSAQRKRLNFKYTPFNSLNSRHYTLLISFPVGWNQPQAYMHFYQVLIPTKISDNNYSKLPINFTFIINLNPGTQ